MEEAKPPRVAIGNFTITLNLSDKRGLSVQGVIYSDDTPKELNERLDMFQDVLDRQHIRADVQNKEAQINQLIESLEPAAQGYEDLVELKKKGKRLTSQQLQSLDHYDTNVRSVKRNVESLQHAVRAGRMKLNGVAPAA